MGELTHFQGRLVGGAVAKFGTFLTPSEVHLSARVLTGSDGVEKGTADNPLRVADATAATVLAAILAALGEQLDVAGTVTASAGENLNTSALALENGGNLAALVARDFATQTTLSALSANVGNPDDAPESDPNESASATSRLAGIQQDIQAEQTEMPNSAIAGKSVLLDQNGDPVEFGAYETFALGQADTINAAVVKSGPGTLLGAKLWNASAAPAFVLFFDQADAPDPTTDTPFARLMVPGGAFYDGDANVVTGAAVTLPMARDFEIGLGVCVVTGAAAGNNDAPAANVVGGIVEYA